MTELCKLMFDLALYYAITGYFTVLIFNEAPSPVGFLFLLAVILVDSLLRRHRKEMRVIQFCFLLLPFAAALSKPGLCQILQALPAWLYIGWCIVTDRVEIDYIGFKDHFGFVLRLQALLLFGIPFWSRIPTAFLQAVPYLVLMLADGVCVMRMLRENRPNSFRHGLYVGGFVLLCAALTAGQVPQLLVSGFGLLYQKVLSRLLFGIVLLFGGIGYALYSGLKWLVSLIKGTPEPIDVQLQSAAEALGLEEELELYTADLTWLRILLIVVAALFAALILFLIFRRLMGHGGRANMQHLYSEQREKILTQGTKTRTIFPLRPKNPRLAVRYYFAKFLAEARRRGKGTPEGMTATELAEYCASVFPGADTAGLAAIYAPARYSNREAVSAADADRAAAAWKELKRTKNDKI